MLFKVVFPAATAPIWNGVRYGFRYTQTCRMRRQLISVQIAIKKEVIYATLTSFTP
jgi:hypothetical protein